MLIIYETYVKHMSNARQKLLEYTWKYVHCYFTALYSVTLRKKRKGGHFLLKTCYRHFRCRAQMMSLRITPSSENNICFIQPNFQTIWLTGFRVAKIFVRSHSVLCYSGHWFLQIIIALFNKYMSMRLNICNLFII